MDQAQSVSTTTKRCGKKELASKYVSGSTGVVAVIRSVLLILIEEVPYILAYKPNNFD